MLPTATVAATRCQFRGGSVEGGGTLSMGEDGDPLWTEWHTLVKTLPFPAVGNKRDSTKMTTGSRLNDIGASSGWVGIGFTKIIIACLLPIREIGTIQLFVHKWQISLPDGKTTDLRLVLFQTYPETEIPYSWLAIHALCEQYPQVTGGHTVNKYITFVSFSRRSASRLTRVWRVPLPTAPTSRVSSTRPSSTWTPTTQRPSCTSVRWPPSGGPTGARTAS